MEIEVFKNEDIEGIQDLIIHIQVKEFGLPITKEDQPDLTDIEKYYVKLFRYSPRLSEMY